MLSRAAAEHRDVTLVLANQGEAPGVVRDYLAGQALDSSRVILDPAQRVGRHFGVRGLPTTLFFGPDGRVQAIHVGELSLAVLEGYLTRIRTDG